MLWLTHYAAGLQGIADLHHCVLLSHHKAVVVLLIRDKLKHKRVTTVRYS